MATPEAKVKALVVKMLVSFDAYHFFPAANGFGRAGIPDIIVCLNGDFLAVECKAGKGRTTALQDRELARIRDAGGRAIIVNETPEAMAALRLVLTSMKAPCAQLT